VDSVSGEAYLMEINGRFWGSLQLAIDAGVDFPAIWLDHVINPTAALPAPSYATGIRVRSITSLVDHVADRLLHSPQRLSLPANIPSLAWVITRLMQWHPRDRFETLRLQDPGPFLREIRLWAVRRLLGR
jgi:hypothetical protein